ncbi:MAG TPA: DUF1501 domain-containing protein [Methylomirabilota bacterium]|nr:DUF1501 domain-containing protein [Methylomirabilota bacterium]
MNPCTERDLLGRVLDRRAFLGQTATALTGLALTRLLTRDLWGREAPAGVPHYRARAKQILHIFCPGGVSHVDLWEHKPELEKRHGEPLPGEGNFLSFQGKNGNLMKSPWPFVPAGRGGKLISSLLPRLARHVDDIAFIHSMTSRTNTHGPGCVFMNTGFAREGFPSAGAWISHALGSANENLPTFIAMRDVRGEPPNGKANWSNGFLPARHQAVAISAQQPIRNLSRPDGVTEDGDVATRDYLRRLNLQHAAERPGDSELRARIAAYELAARMQLAAPEAADPGREPASIHRLYGTDDSNRLKAAYARNCLLARRFLERGVRYVSLYCASRASGVDGLLNWDAHKTLKSDYERHCPIFDGPTAALLSDLKSRGMLEDVLVLWTTEFGRMPTHQEGTSGRDHNPDGFTCWMMGAGVRGGVSHGATDEFGRRAVDRVTTVYDYYATVLHLMGFDHERLIVRHNGADRRLTDVHGHVIREVLADGG